MTLNFRIFFEMSYLFGPRKVAKWKQLIALRKVYEKGLQDVKWKRVARPSLVEAELMALQAMFCSKSLFTGMHV